LQTPSDVAAAAAAKVIGSIAATVALVAVLIAALLVMLLLRRRASEASLPDDDEGGVDLEGDLTFGELETYISEYGLSGRERESGAEDASEASEREMTDSREFATGE